MSKRAFLIHGWDGNPKNAWFPWAKKELEKKDFEVLVPAMPDPEEPEIKSWVDKLAKTVGNIDGDTYLIGHSIGCQTILRYLEKLSENEKVKAVILVAPWMSLDEQTIKEEGEDVWEIAKPWIETPIDIEKVKTHSNKFAIVYSTNDPYANSDDLLMLKEKLDALTVNAGNKGHFDDDANIKELPEIIDVIDEIESGE